MQSMTTGNLNTADNFKKTASQSITPKTDADGIETGRKKYGKEMVCMGL